MKDISRMLEWSMVVLNIHDPKALNSFCIDECIDKIVFKWTTTQLVSLVNCCRDTYGIRHTSVEHLSVKSQLYRHHLPMCDKRRKVEIFTITSRLHHIVTIIYYRQTLLTTEITSSLVCARTDPVSLPQCVGLIRCTHSTNATTYTKTNKQANNTQSVLRNEMCISYTRTPSERINALLNY